MSEDGGSASQLEMPKIMEQHTKIQMPVEDFKYMVGTLMELGARRISMVGTLMELGARRR